ncbi:MAG: LPXTG cell wall anchor domain-containing protein [Gemmataceae bacterium]
MDFLNSWAFMGIMGALLVGLIGLLLFLRNKKEDE